MKKRLTTEGFVERAKLVHGDKFDYSETVYVKDTVNVCVVCKTCNKKFYPRPSHHLSGTGCPHCAKEKQKNAGNINARRIRYGFGVIDYPFNVANLRSFHVWCDMLQRCYDEKTRYRNPSYEGVTVCEEWLSFSKFKDWFDENYIEGFQLDKDILCGKQNKVYSPQTCCFIPPELNSLLTKANSNRGDFPIGVYKQKYGKYTASIRKEGKSYYLGSFDTPEEAFVVYKKAREEYVKEKANHFFSKNMITQKVYNALMNYKVEITD